MGQKGVKVFQQELSIVLGGGAGQGIQTIEKIVVKILKSSGLHVFASKEYMSRVRGGINSTEIRVSSQQVSCFIDRIDILIPLAQGTIAHLGKRVTEETIIIGDPDLIKQTDRVLAVPLLKIATEIGSKIFANTITAGIIAGLLEIEKGVLEQSIRHIFGHKDEALIAKNVQAVLKGFTLGQRLRKDHDLSFLLTRNPERSRDIVLNGAEGVGLGALTGGCNFIAAYPMSPSTGVFTFLAQRSQEFGVIAEQVEDEISAINMALGAWYAGGRALITTSGGGFALMEEGVSLAGMLEIPVVIHLAQRPGPATGLPTRTEQADLELALYAGHGEFPRVLYAPGSIEDTVELTRKAFETADRFQVPVFILTDQYLLDSYYNIPHLALAEAPPVSSIIKTGENYKRYTITADGISPRGVPGFGRGLICVDSDEHDESGLITEDHSVRTAMVEKRFRKLSQIQKHALPPIHFGPDGFTKLIICWGSNYHVVREAVNQLKDPDLAMLFLPQVYPVPQQCERFFAQAQKVAVIENNATGQLAKLLQLQLQVRIHEKILKYDGLPFSLEEVIRAISSFSQ